MLCRIKFRMSSGVSSTCVVGDGRAETAPRRTFWHGLTLTEDVLGSVPVYADGSITVAELGKVGKTPIFGSNVLYFELADDSSFIIRPSGTEPKIKIYLLVRGGSEAECAGKIEKLSAFVEELGK